MEEELLGGALSPADVGSDVSGESPAAESIPIQEPPPVPFPTSVYPELLAIPPSTAPIPDRKLEGYFRITQDDLLWVGDFTVPDGAPNKPIVKTFLIPGDNIYVQIMDGTARWGIRLGADSNPLIRLREGLIITRPFTKFTLYSMDAAGVGTLSAAQAQSERQRSRFEILVSTGALVHAVHEKQYGFGPASIGRIDCLANTTPRLFNQDYQPLQGGVTFESLTLGSDGGLLYIRNSDSFNTLVLNMVQYNGAGILGFGTDVWRLYPGEVFPMLVDGRMSDFADQSGLQVYTRTGTCLYDWYFSRRSSEPPTTLISTPPY